MKRRWNVLLYAGFLCAVAGFVSYSWLLQYPLTRDFPWVNLLLFGVALILLGTGLARAFRQPQTYRGKISGPILALLSVAMIGFFLFITFSLTKRLPASKGAPQAGWQAPDFTLPDTNGNPVTLSKLWGSSETGAAGGRKDHWVVLVFYRGYW